MCYFLSLFLVVECWIVCVLIFFLLLPQTSVQPTSVKQCLFLVSAAVFPSVCPPADNSRTSPWRWSLSSYCCCGASPCSLMVSQPVSLSCIVGDNVAEMQDKCRGFIWTHYVTTPLCLCLDAVALGNELFNLSDVTSPILSADFCGAWMLNLVNATSPTQVYFLLQSRLHATSPARRTITLCWIVPVQTPCQHTQSYSKSPAGTNCC